MHRIKNTARTEKAASFRKSLPLNSDWADDLINPDRPLGREQVVPPTASIERTFEDLLTSLVDSLTHCSGDRLSDAFRNCLEQVVEAFDTDRLEGIANILANTIARTRTEERLLRVQSQVSESDERYELESLYRREEIELSHTHNAVIGQSHAIREVLRKAEQVAPMDSAVLILGETGTGKELIARTIHELSRRHDRQMIRVNCAAMPATLIESELFGREKGAYTGALSREIGRFELADRSTIFLDEIGEMPLEVQAKLLRVLQDGEFERLGSSRTIHVNARVIAATNRDLQTAVREGKFREDLYYRLNVFPIEIPPLRERREDIPALTWHSIKRLCKQMGIEIDSIHPLTMKALREYSWPGNVRELGNLIERYLILNRGPVFRAEIPRASRPALVAGERLEDVERHHILMVLRRTNWRIRGREGTAEILGIKPTTLEARMKKLGISRPQEFGKQRDESLDRDTQRNIA